MGPQIWREESATNGYPLEKGGKGRHGPFVAKNPILAAQDCAAMQELWRNDGGMLTGLQNWQFNDKTSATTLGFINCNVATLQFHQGPDYR